MEQVHPVLEASKSIYLSMYVYIRLCTYIPTNRLEVKQSIMNVQWKNNNLDSLVKQFELLG